MNRRTPDEAMNADDPTRRQPAYAFLQAFREGAKRGEVPAYVPEALRGVLLRMKTRHNFSNRG